jgi:DNA repair exonuclease SbcCD nuclease subunit
MKILVAGDLHLTDKCPVNRIDNYEDTLFRKLQFITDIANQHDCNIILQPGDFFDQPNPSYAFLAKVIDFFEHNHETFVYTIFGQHDLKYRNPENTALSVLNKFGPVYLLDWKYEIANISIQGCNWGEGIPKPIEGRFNILLIHRMIVDDKLWAEQEHFDYANGFLRDNAFDLIVSGDNHKYFTKSFRGRYLFNCGSMMRSTIAQIDHTPTVIVFDTEDPKSFIEIPIPIEPSEKVFKMEAVAIEKERDHKLDAFVNGLTEHKEMGLSFEDNLRTYVEQNGLNDEIYTLIKRGMCG